MSNDDFAITAPQLEHMLKIMRAAPTDLLLSTHCRHFLAKSRFEKRGGEVNVFNTPDTGVMPGTIGHNRQEFDTFASISRPGRLISALSAIEGVYGRAKDLKVLSVGPRTEMELLQLVGMGFSPANVYALDLISSSPWIDLGDMHAMPYENEFFDVVISNWVLAYSKTPEKAVSEMIRVTKSGGLVAMGATFNPRAGEVDYTDPEAKIVGTMFRSTSQYKAMMGKNLGRVHFEDEPVDDVQGAVMLVARVAR